LGGIAGGDEIIGFNRSFIYAGSPRVISSLWKVDDLATAILAKIFYRGLKSGLTPAKALQSAQKHIRDRINTHPSYWAAFQLTGEPQGSLTKTSLSN
jgi:CHAT domain-containing protein